MVKFPVFSTDGASDYCHFSPIKKLVFDNRQGGAGTAQIGALDEMGVVSLWSVIEMREEIAQGMVDFELNMSIGSKYKLIENYSQNLLFFPEAAIGEEGISKEVGSSLELEFDSRDPNIFYFSSSEGLFSCTRSGSPVRLDTTGLGSPSALSSSD